MSLQATPISFTSNVQTSNTFKQPQKIINASRDPKSQQYFDDTYGLIYGPNSVYQIVWPFPVYSVTDNANEDMTYVDPNRQHFASLDTNEIQDKEEIFIGGVVPTSGGRPLFNPVHGKYKFKRPFKKIR